MAKSLLPEWEKVFGFLEKKERTPKRILIGVTVKKDSSSIPDFFDFRSSYKFLPNLPIPQTFPELSYQEKTFSLVRLAYNNSY